MVLQPQAPSYNSTPQTQEKPEWAVGQPALLFAAALGTVPAIEFLPQGPAQPSEEYTPSANSSLSVTASRPATST